MTAPPYALARIDPAHDRVGLRPWGAALLLGAVNCLAFCDRTLLAFLAPAVKVALGLSDSALGALVGTAVALPYVAGTALFAVFGDRLGRLRAVRLSLLGWTLASAASGLAASGAGLLAARIGLGLCQAPLTPAAAAHLAGVFPADRIGRGTSLFTAGATLGRSVAFLGGGAVLAGIGLPLLGQEEGWRVVFILTLLPGAMLLLLLTRLREPPALGSARSADGGLWDWVRANRRAFLLHTLAAAMVVVVIQTLTAWTTTVLVGGHGLALAAAGSLFGTMILVCAPLGHLSGGVLLDAARARFGPRSPGLVIAGCLALSLPAVLLFGQAARLDHAVVGLACATLLLGLGAPACLAGMQMLAPPALRARATALFMACVTALGFGLGPPVVGALSDYVFGTARIGAALALVAGCATLIGLTAIAAQRPAP